MSNKPSANQANNQDKTITPQLTNGHDLSEARKSQNNAARKISEKQAEINERYDKLVMPDDYYVGAPCGVGKLVRDVMDKTGYPSGAMAYHAVLAIKAVLMSRFCYLSTPSGIITPNYYSILFANTGRGKDSADKVVSQTLQHLLPDFLISNKPKSGVGIYDFLRLNKNVGLYVIDEIHGVITAMNNPNSQGYLREIGDVLLSLYSKASWQTFRYEKASTKQKDSGIHTLHRPHLNLIGSTVCDNFNSMFSQGTFTSGLMQRVQCSFASKQRPVGKYPNSYDMILRDAYLEHLSNNNVTKLEDEAEAEFSGFELEKSTTSEYERIELDEDAKKLAHEIKVEFDLEYNKQTTKNDPLLAARLTEKTLKEAFLISDGSVSRAALEFALGQSRYQNSVLQLKLEEINDSESYQKSERVLSKLAELIQKGNGQLVTRRELQQSCRNLTTFEFRELITSLEDSGRIFMGKTTMPSGQSIKTIGLIED